MSPARLARRHPVALTGTASGLIVDAPVRLEQLLAEPDEILTDSPSVSDDVTVNHYPDRRPSGT